MSLPLQWREWAIPRMRFGVRFTDIGHMGQSDATLRSHRASEHEGATAGELYALLVGKQGESLGVRATLAPWLTRWSRERHRHGVDHSPRDTSVARRQQLLNHLQSPLQILIRHALDPTAVGD